MQKKMETTRKGVSITFLWILAKSRWNRQFWTNDLCETSIFQVIKVYFWGGMAASRAR